MKRRVVLFTETAQAHVRIFQRWWIENSLRPEIVGLRRVYLRRLGVHIYYTYTGEETVILALWHTRRGHGPQF